jgi:hypothetical protein
MVTDEHGRTHKPLYFLQVLCFVNPAYAPKAGVLPIALPRNSLGPRQSSVTDGISPMGCSVRSRSYGATRFTPVEAIAAHRVLRPLFQ